MLYWRRQLDHNRASYNLQDDVHPPLEEFYYSLLNLIEALQCIENEKGIINSLGLTTITQAQQYEKAMNPIEVVRKFCQRYPQIYARRELWCFMYAVIENASDMPRGFQPATILDWYEQVLALTEVAYQLIAESNIPESLGNN